MLTVAVGMVVSLLIGLPALRIRGLYLAVATLSFSLSAEYLIFRSDFYARGTAGVDIRPPKLGPLDLDSPTQRPMFFFCVICFALTASGGLLFSLSEPADARHDHHRDYENATREVAQARSE